MTNGRVQPYLASICRRFFAAVWGTCPETRGRRMTFGKESGSWPGRSFTDPLETGPRYATTFAKNADLAPIFWRIFYEIYFRTSETSCDVELVLNSDYGNSPAFKFLWWTFFNSQFPNLLIVSRNSLATLFVPRWGTSGCERFYLCHVSIVSSAESSAISWKHHSKWFRGTSALNIRVNTAF